MLLSHSRSRRTEILMRDASWDCRSPSRIRKVRTQKESQDTLWRQPKNNLYSCLNTPSNLMTNVGNVNRTLALIDPVVRAGTPSLCREKGRNEDQLHFC